MSSNAKKAILLVNLGSPDSPSVPDVRKYLAVELRPLFEQVYEQNQSSAPYLYNATAVAARSLKNTALNYLMLLDDPQWFERARNQYAVADNGRRFVIEPTAGMSPEETRVMMDLIVDLAAETGGNCESTRPGARRPGSRSVPRSSATSRPWRPPSSTPTRSTARASSCRAGGRMPPPGARARCGSPCRAPC